MNVENKKFFFLFIVRKYKRSCKPPVPATSSPTRHSTPHLLVILSASEESWYASIVTPASYKPQGPSYQSYPIIISSVEKRSGETLYRYSSQLSANNVSSSLTHNTGLRISTETSTPKNYKPTVNS